MDQASALPAASCARNPAAPRTLPSWLPSEGQARTVVPSRDGSAPQSGPHSEPVHIVPSPSSPALCQSDAKGYLLPDDYSGATGIPGRFSEGLLLRRLHPSLFSVADASRLVRQRRHLQLSQMRSTISRSPISSKISDGFTAPNTRASKPS